MAVLVASVDASGNVVDPVLDGTSKGSKQSQERVLNIVKGLKNLGIPPGTSLPIKLHIAPCGTHGVDVYNEKLDYSPYMKELQHRMKSAWLPPKDREDRKTTIKFKVISDGTMSAATVSQSSGIKLLDDACMRALENASPFLPLPAGAPDDIEIEFTFDYHSKP